MRNLTTPAIVLLTAAMAVGGAGVTYPFLQAGLILIALAVAAWSLGHPVGGYRVQLARPLLAVAAGCALLPLLQLIPLPPLVWEALPGREQASELDRLLGWHLWRPWTLDVEATVRTTLVMIPGLVLLFVLLRLGTKERLLHLQIVAAFALFSAVLGMMQLASAGGFTPFPSAHSGFPIGLFVNRNHQATLLLASMPVVAAIGALRLSTGARTGPTLAIILSAISIIAVAAVSTTSRMAVAVLPFSLATSLALLFLRQSLVRIVLPSALAISLLVGMLWFGGGISRSLSRFSSLEDSRFDYWSDVNWALGNYGLAGTGVGTFVPVHQSAESLSAVTKAVLNHAHNDYIELLLEGGLPAIILFAGFFGLLTLAVGRKLRSREGHERVLLAGAASSGIAVILIFSLVDYPLRMPAIAAAFVLLLTFVLPSAGASKEIEISRPRRSLAAPGSKVASRAGYVLIAIFSFVTLQAAVSARKLWEGSSDGASWWAPWSSEAHSRQATQALFVTRDPAEARRHARAALRLSPLNAPAIRTAGILFDLGGQRPRSAALMEMAARMGWRDVPTQLWAIDAARLSNDPPKAVQRAEALYQQGVYLPAATEALMAEPIGSSAALLLAKDLAERPSWRREFFRSADRLSPSAHANLQLIADRLSRTQAPVSLDEAAPLLDALRSPEHIARRETFWRTIHSKALVANGGFEQTSDYRGPQIPSDWDISNEDIGSLAIDRPGFGNKGNAVRLYRARGGTPLLAQQMMLAPGGYTLRFAHRSGDGAAARLGWELRCLDSNASYHVDFSTPGPSAWHSSVVRFNIPKNGCRSQRLALKRVGPAADQMVWLDEISIRLN